MKNRNENIQKRERGYTEFRFLIAKDLVGMMPVGESARVLELPAAAVSFQSGRATRP